MISLFMIFFLNLSYLTGTAHAGTPVLLPMPVVETLPSGLKVAWFIDNRLPVVDLSLIVQAGHRNDPFGKSGTVELVAASLDRGAGGMTAQQLSRAIDFLGGIHYSSVLDDSLIVGMHGLATDTSGLLEILGKLVLHPDFLKAQVETQRDRLLDRWSHLEDYGGALVSAAYRRIFGIAAQESQEFGNDLYGRSGLSSIRELKGVSREDVEQFYRKYFTVKNSILVVVGRVDPAVFRPEITAVFGAWGVGDGAKEIIPLEFSKVTSRVIRSRSKNKSLIRKRGSIVLLDRPLLTQAQIRLGFRVPSVRSSEYYPLLVANALLGGYFGSRLNTEIRDKLALTYGITSAITHNKEFGEFTISTATRSELVGPLIQKVTDVLELLKKGTIQDSEVEIAQAYLEGGFPLSASTLEAVASRWLTGFVFNLGAGYLNEFVSKIHAVTPLEVQSAIQNNFDLKNRVVVIAGDAKEIKKSLAMSKFKSIRLVGVSDLR